MITETSRGGGLEDRRAWLRESLGAIELLRADGVPVVGYTWFPFTALIDWAYREATTPLDDWIVQMGMVDLHRVPGGGALERHPTALMDDYAAAAQQGMPPHDGSTIRSSVNTMPMASADNAGRCPQLRRTLPATDTTGAVNTVMPAVGAMAVAVVPFVAWSALSTAAWTAERIRTHPERRRRRTSVSMRRTSPTPT